MTAEYLVEGLLEYTLRIVIVAVDQVIRRRITSSERQIVRLNDGRSGNGLYPVRARLVVGHFRMPESRLHLGTEIRRGRKIELSCDSLRAYISAVFDVAPVVRAGPFGRNKYYSVGAPGTVNGRCRAVF